MINETLVLLNSYFLFLFSDFVVNPEDRYLMGWVNIVLLGLMVATNIGIVFFKEIQSVWRYLKLKKLKRTHT